MPSVLQKTMQFLHLTKKPDEPEPDSGPMARAIAILQSRTSSRNYVLSPKAALSKYGKFLSPFGKKEILLYDKIYYTAEKPHYLNAPVDALQRNIFVYKNGHYKIVLEDQIAYRYYVYTLMYSGENSQVVMAADLKIMKQVALKIDRLRAPLALNEARMLRMIREWDYGKDSNIIMLHNDTVFRYHPVLVFDKCQHDLKDRIRENSTGLPIQEIKKICQPLLKALAFLRQHGVIHGDIKPENIRFDDQGKLKLSGFRYSCLENEATANRYTDLYSRAYRAPEIICSGRPTFAIDIWAFGCVLGEMMLGHKMFDGFSDADHLRRVEELLGYPPNAFFTYCESTQVLSSPLDDPTFLKYFSGPRAVNNASFAVPQCTPSSALEKIFSNDRAELLPKLQHCIGWVPRLRLMPDIVPSKIIWARVPQVLP